MTNPRTGERKPKVVILGALSTMAEAAARLWAEQGAHLLLAGRDQQRLDAVAADLHERGASVDTLAGDLTLADKAEPALDSMVARLGGVDVILLAYGMLGDQKLAERDLAQADHILTTNFTSASRWCLAAANILERQGHGTLVVLGSVAGDRGRASNYIYGASKAGLGVLVQGIAHRLAGSGARAVLVKPGFVDTQMTAHIAPKGLLWAKPEAIARIIVRLGRRGGPSIAYAPAFWKWIMYVIRFMPTSLFHRTKL